MIWFHQCAHDVMKEYDKPEDGDGPRHFEYGIGLMVGKLLQLIAKRKGMESAEKTAKFIVQQVGNWEAYKGVTARTGEEVEK